MADGWRDERRNKLSNIRPRAWTPGKLTIPAERCPACGFERLALPHHLNCPVCVRSKGDPERLQELEAYDRTFVLHNDGSVYEHLRAYGKHLGPGRRVRDYDLVETVLGIYMERQRQKAQVQDRTARAVHAYAGKKAGDTP